MARRARTVLSWRIDFAGVVDRIAEGDKEERWITQGIMLQINLCIAGRICPKIK